MLELRIVSGGTSLPLFDLPAMLGRKSAAREIGDTIESLIAFMDDLGGDPDREANGDELDGNGSEDDFMFHGDDGPGCPIADSDEGGEEHGEPSAWIEWQTRGRHKLERGGEILSRDRHGNPRHEDDEDDDPREDDDSDRCEAGDDHMIAGPVVMRTQWERFGRDSAFNHDDAEDGGDTELNGDEHDHSQDPNA